MNETVYIQLGSNIGDRESYLKGALERIESLEGFEVIAVSGIYVSEAQDMDEHSPPFLNQVVKGDYQYTASELLHSLEKIERELGRTSKGKNEPRTIDLDILLFGDQIIDTARLRVPHPELLNRPFVMIPLLEIDTYITHPAGKRPIADFIGDKDHAQVMLYKDHVSRNIRA